VRSRLSQSPLARPVTLTTDVGVYDLEAFVLDRAYELYRFDHWIAHHAALHLWIEKKLHAAYSCGEEFLRLREVVGVELARAGFDRQSADLVACADEEQFNAMIVRQYTEETPLYSACNELLRLGHTGRDVGAEPLAPWILQLNTAIRRQPEHLERTYRGAKLDAGDIAEYQPGLIFIWSALTSTSMNEDCCKGGNVLFEFTPGSPAPFKDKRAGRIIGPLSVYPEEQEVLLPLCCGYRVLSRDADGDRTRIKLEILDHY
jgi:hypothetical protein